MGRTVRVKLEGVGEWDVPEGLDLRGALLREGVFLDGPCGGQGRCGRCVVRILRGDAGAPGQTEKGLLGLPALARGERLACRVALRGDLEVSVSPGKILDVDRAGAGKGFWGSPLWIPARFPLTPRPGYGAALDLGTTSLAAVLFDLSSGTPLATGSLPNPQLPWGADILTRLQAASSDPAVSRRMSEEVWKGVGNLLKTLVARAGVTPGRVLSLVAVANPAVHHLALGMDPASLLRPPFAPSSLDNLDLRVSDLPFPLPVASSASIHFPPLLGGFVGSDAAVSLLAARAASPRGALLDVGTNCEMAFWEGEALVAGSAPAGPAFEGGRIRQGMRADVGAVWKVSLTEDGARLSVLGGGPPRGLCGTGLVDVTAELVRRKLVDRRGSLKAGGHPLLGRPGLLLSRDPEVLFTPGDLEEIQKAKAAVAAGFKVLEGEWERAHPAKSPFPVYLSGAFGSRLDVESAVAIGLLPDWRRDRFIPAGNSALVGASFVLLSEEARDDLGVLVPRVRHISVAELPAFEETFLDSLFFSP